MTGKHIRKVDSLSRLMRYILGIRPDESGLVPDREGFIPIKELLKVIHEEPSMGYIRESHLTEVILQDKEHLFEIAERKIRSRQRSFVPLSEHEAPVDPPKLLFKGVKRKVYSAVLANGLAPGPGHHVVMTADRDMAARIASRQDQRPVIIEIRAQAASESGTAFFAFGEYLYVADTIPARFINGPPLPKVLPDQREPSEPKEDFMPGSFLIKDDRDHDPMRQDKARKKRGWKEEARKLRRKRHAGWA
jgi:putative RNA 2'-phosphotransferase